MGALGKWLKSLIGLKKTQSSHQENMGSSGKGRKWRLWRSDKASHVLAFDSSLFGVDDAFSVAVATVVTATTKEFMVVRQEWVAIRIQTMFRAFLCKTSFKGIESSSEATSDFPRQASQEASCSNTKGGWCDSPGIAKELKAKLQMRQESVIKRERTIAHSLSQQWEMAEITDWSQEDPIKKMWAALVRVESGGYGGGGYVAMSDSSSFGVDDVFSAAVATVLRATTKNFVVVRQEWVAIKIQTMFQAFLE
ncbi:unnamed protein product [Camellia sinensis]